jgi:hypothetical protein
VRHRSSCDICLLVEEYAPDHAVRRLATLRVLSLDTNYYYYYYNSSLDG